MQGDTCAALVNVKKVAVMSWNLWLLYVSLAAAVIASPGPSALLCVTHAVSHGARKTLATIVGGITASMTLMVLSALGLGAVIAASDTLFHVIKWAGAAYLIYLGIATWRSRPQPEETGQVIVESSTTAATPVAPAALVAPVQGMPSATTWGQLFRKGYMVGIGNPKDLLFFSALFPQFMNPAEPIVGQLLILGVSWMVLDGSIMFAYALCGAKVIARLGRGGVGRWFQRVTGGAFIAAGGVLAASGR
ncbi:LysE family translocator [Comamonas sp.]